MRMLREVVPAPRTPVSETAPVPLALIVALSTLTPFAKLLALTAVPLTMIAPLVVETFAPPETETP